MFSLDNFYYVLHANFLQPFKVVDCWFKEFGSTDPKDFVSFVYYRSPAQPRRLILYYDQEPIFEHNFNTLMAFRGHYDLRLMSANNQKILANSEISELKTKICRECNFIDWYYFTHGLLALEWFRDFKYLPKQHTNFTKVFITLNNLVTKDRSYRLNLVARLLEYGLQDQGLISCRLGDDYGHWKDDLLTSQYLDKESKIKIYNQFKNLDKPLVVDTDNTHGALSAQLDLSLMQSALWHIVGETIFYHNKLHLTEKIFKPIVARRPFMLLAAPGNLEYLKRYGFKTFDRWVDESYDSEPDPNVRVKMVTDQIKKMCEMSTAELQVMYTEMQETLDYNYDHFYGKFKEIVVTEMSENFEKCLKQMNVGYGYWPDRQIDPSLFNKQDVIRRLMQ